MICERGGGLTYWAIAAQHQEPFNDFASGYIYPETHTNTTVFVTLAYKNHPNK